MMIFHRGLATIIRNAIDFAALCRLLRRAGFSTMVDAISSAAYWSAVRNRFARISSGGRHCGYHRFATRMLSSTGKPTAQSSCASWTLYAVDSFVGSDNGARLPLCGETCLTPCWLLLLCEFPFMRLAQGASVRLITVCYVRVKPSGASDSASDQLAYFT